MEWVTNILPWAQITLSVLLVATILLQQTGASLGGAFGGSDNSTGFHTRRGAEKVLFYATIVIAILLAASALLALIV
ncbi:MAG: preprotein translocase subunit SecG [Candidatus Yonathbacteria bacterium]|nr:preprotein translocase subunit SecG [Candidatus Yonathbacteria bacterium]MCR4330963.1 preprotein translocase subunit SecG [Patescibacteria group bacterium]